MTNLICKNMKQLILIVLFISILPFSKSFGQCPTDVNYGQNTIVNGDFSNGYTSWSFTPQTIPWTGDPPALQADGYIIHGAPSLPGDLLVGTNPNTQFNNGFQTFGDHTTGAGNFLMVDGVCKLGVKVFSQTVSVKANTNYYFSIWINSLKDNPTNPGVLNFDVNGANLGTITAPALGGASAGGAWIKYEVVWNSGAFSGSLPISIATQNTSLCSNQVDFAIDDISFIPGCAYGSPGPQPDLGPDLSLCGRGGAPITLNSNVPHNATTTVTWSDGTTGTGLLAPYTKTVNAAGTYSVCVVDNGSCQKSDVIVITNTFSVSIGPDINLCSVTTKTLDAVFAGPGVTYKWYKNFPTVAPGASTNSTYSANSAGTYRVDVTDPLCGTQTATMNITTTSTATPIDAYYCATSATQSPTLSVTGSNAAANYDWYDAVTGGTLKATGTKNYTVSPAITIGSTATYTFYVQDNTAATGTLGPTTIIGSDENFYPSNLGNVGLYFSANQNLKINSVQIPIKITTNNGNMNISFNYSVLKSNGSALSIPITGVTNVVTVPGTTSAYTFFTFNTAAIDISQALAVSDGPNFLLQITARNTTYSDNDFRVAITNSVSTYPYASSLGASIASITGGYVYGGPRSNEYGGLYNWNISTVTPCSRVPVRAISNCVTPVTWTSFYLVSQSNACKLVWNTATETNNSYFTVERSSDGIHFETIGTITGAGNRDIASNYYYIDNDPLSGSSYYRITQHDYDGKFSSTAMKPYSSEGVIQVTTYPNPFQNNTTLLVSGADASTYSYTLYSVSGQLVEQGSGTLNQIQTIGEALSKGMYMLTVLTNINIITTKIVKQ
jgi:hypothetical protein